MNKIISLVFLALGMIGAAVVAHAQESADIDHNGTISIITIHNNNSLNAMCEEFAQKLGLSTDMGKDVALLPRRDLYDDVVWEVTGSTGTVLRVPRLEMHGVLQRLNVPEIDIVETGVCSMYDSHSYKKGDFVLLIRGGPEIAAQIAVTLLL